MANSDQQKPQVLDLLGSKKKKKPDEKKRKYSQKILHSALLISLSFYLSLCDSYAGIRAIRVSRGVKREHAVLL